MSTGKYSPTVTASYRRDQEWHGRWRQEGEWYDREGYDEFGYNQQGRDRAGHSEEDYLGAGHWASEDDDEDNYVPSLYEDTYSDWCDRLLGDLNEKGAK